jgi:hypothetical protein
MVPVPAASDYASSAVPFTTQDGWQYTVTPSIGTISVTVFKDVSESPPGLARLKMIVSGSGIDFDVAGATPGRFPPTIAVVPRWLFIPFNDSANGGDWQEDSSQNCTREWYREYWVDEMRDPTPLPPFAIACALSDAAFSEWNGHVREFSYLGSFESSEANVDAALAGFVQPSRPIITAYPSYAPGLDFIFLPGGAVDLAPGNA